jgi:hypothetical protein
MPARRRDRFHGFGITIEDQLSVDFSDVVDEMVAFIERSPGVASVVREDREFIKVTTDREVDAKSFCASLLRWTEDRLISLVLDPPDPE